MFCKNCGIEVQNGWVKCPKCGTAISDEVREQLKVTQKPEMYRTTWKAVSYTHLTLPTT